VHYVPVERRRSEADDLVRMVDELLHPELTARRREATNLAHARFVARQAQARAADARFRWLAFGAGATLILGPLVGVAVAVAMFGIKVLVIGGGGVLLLLLGGPRRLARGVGGGLNTMILRWRT
jgi:hypothetical protein